LNAAVAGMRMAERLYREALAKNAELLSARQNLAALLAQDPGNAAMKRLRCGEEPGEG